MHHMGFSYFQFFRYFTKVFAEPIAYTIFLYAFYRLVLWFTNKDKFYDTLPITCLLFSTSCILRPNLSSSSFFLLLIPLFYLARFKKYKYLFFYFLTGSIIFRPLFHNLYFGNKFVIFTDAVFSDANIKITIYDYLSILMFDEISIYKKDMLYEMLGNFINPFEIHKYFILGMIIISININNLKNSYLLPLYVLIFSQLYLFFFFRLYACQFFTLMFFDFIFCVVQLHYRFSLRSRCYVSQFCSSTCPPKVAGWHVEMFFLPLFRLPMMFFLLNR